MDQPGQERLPSASVAAPPGAGTHIDDDGATPPVTPARTRSDRSLDLLVPILLAALGLVGALVAWRVGVATDVAQDATLAGQSAARALTEATTVASGEVARTYDAWLDYERAQRRAAALRAAGLESEALEQTQVAVSNWFLVRPEYLEPDGRYDAERHRAAYLAEAATEADLDPRPHFATAEHEYGRVNGLLNAGVVIALALPFLTLGEITRRPVRVVAIVVGTAVFIAGIALAAMVWA